MLLRFLLAEDGTVSTDWVLLTALMLGTAIAVMNTVAEGAHEASNAQASKLRGIAVQRAFAPAGCSDGIAGVQAREDARIAAGGGDPVDVGGWIAASGARSDAELLREHESLSARAGPPSQATSWTRVRTLHGAATCALALRDLPT